MNFVCDVHISYKLVSYLNSQGLHAVHVNDILDKWHTKDREISAYADAHDAILVTKDSDFKDSFFLKETPRKLIKVSLGNISNQGLLKAISDNLKAIRKLNAGTP